MIIRVLMHIINIFAIVYNIVLAIYNLKFDKYFLASANVVTAGIVLGVYIWCCLKKED